MENISKEGIQEWQKCGKGFVLIDVREPWEHEAFNIGGKLIPMGQLMGEASHLPKDLPLVFYCEKGIRSVIAIQRLQGLGFESLYNLTGGMKGWRAAS